MHKPDRLLRPWIRPLALALSLVLAWAGPGRADDPKPTPPAKVLTAPTYAPAPKITLPEVPANLADLREYQKQIDRVVAKVTPCTVGIRVTMGMGRAEGSGIIISEDGYVLTAGHVSMEPGKVVTVILSDGRQVKADTLGWNNDIDSGLIKIKDEGKWPYVEMGDVKDIKRGQWCVAIGHPGGYQARRAPVVRLGRVLVVNKDFLQTDCTVDQGDSGGPLVDLNGRVIGIHSRISLRLTDNIHVPIATYQETWDRLAKAEKWGNGRIGGGRPSPARRNDDAAYLGVQSNPVADNCFVDKVLDDSPAAKAGIQAGDVILKVDNKATPTFQALQELLNKRKVGEEVTVALRRGEKDLELKIKLGKKPAE
jgi:serine protease Do